MSSVNSTSFLSKIQHIAQLSSKEWNNLQVLEDLSLKEKIPQRSFWCVAAPNPYFEIEGMQKAIFLCEMILREDNFSILQSEEGRKHWPEALKRLHGRCLGLAKEKFKDPMIDASKKCINLWCNYLCRLPTKDLIQYSNKNIFPFSIAAGLLKEFEGIPLDSTALILKALDTFQKISAIHPKFDIPHSDLKNYKEFVANIFCGIIRQGMEHASAKEFLITIFKCPIWKESYDSTVMDCFVKQPLQIGITNLIGSKSTTKERFAYVCKTFKSYSFLRDFLIHHQSFGIDIENEFLFLKKALIDLLIFDLPILWKDKESQVLLNDIFCGFGKKIYLEEIYDDEFMRKKSQISRFSSFKRFIAESFFNQTKVTKEWVAILSEFSVNNSFIPTLYHHSLFPKKINPCVGLIEDFILNPENLSQFSDLIVEFLADFLWDCSGKQGKLGKLAITFCSLDTKLTEKMASLLIKKIEIHLPSILDTQRVELKVKKRELEQAATTSTDLEELNKKILENSAHKTSISTNFPLILERFCTLLKAAQSNSNERLTSLCNENLSYLLIDYFYLNSEKKNSFELDDDDIAIILSLFKKRIEHPLPLDCSMNARNFSFVTLEGFKRIVATLPHIQIQNLFDKKTQHGFLVNFKAFREFSLEKRIQYCVQKVKDLEFILKTSSRGDKNKNPLNELIRFKMKLIHLLLIDLPFVPENILNLIFSALSGKVYLEDIYCHQYFSKRLFRDELWVADLLSKCLFEEKHQWQKVLKKTCSSIDSFLFLLYSLTNQHEHEKGISIFENYIKNDDSIANTPQFFGKLFYHYCINERESASLIKRLVLCNTKNSSYIEAAIQKCFKDKSLHFYKSELNKLAKKSEELQKLPNYDQDQEAKDVVEFNNRRTEILEEYSSNLIEVLPFIIKTFDELLQEAKKNNNLVFYQLSFKFLTAFLPEYLSLKNQKNLIFQLSDKQIRLICDQISMNDFQHFDYFSIDLEKFPEVGFKGMIALIKKIPQLRIQNAFNKERFSDLKIIDIQNPNNSILVNSFILRKNSEYFRGLLNNQLIEGTTFKTSTDSIKFILSIEPKAFVYFKKFMPYFYGDELQIENNEAFAALSIARYYRMDKLISFLDSKIASYLKEDFDDRELKYSLVKGLISKEEEEEDHSFDPFLYKNHYLDQQLFENLSLLKSEILTHYEKETANYLIDFLKKIQNE